MFTVQATITVDLAAIAANYRLLQSRHAKKNVAAVVKADAYGLGVGPVALALRDAGCPAFFVATVEEGVALRSVIPDCPIYIFQGIGEGEGEVFIGHGLSPVLNSIEQMQRWVHLAEKPPAALHVDTGMCRLGLSMSELHEAMEKNLTARCHLNLLMSHLAAASEPQHPLNQEQLARFEAARKLLPGLPCSLANSSGHFLDTAFHYDLGRPGCSLYGITPNELLPNPMQPVAVLKGPILQVRHLDRDETIGYGGTVPVKKGMRIATVGLGYADGVLRNGSNRLGGHIGDYAVPLLGRVSMDMTCFDVTDVPETLLAAEGYVTLIGPRQGVDRVAEICHTIGYEVFTRLGARVRRVYQS